MLGRHGRGNLADRLLGATTYTVTHRASTPVAIIPPDWQPAAS
jgi:nucleotide-binding universal stress UspA family protein